VQVPIELPSRARTCASALRMANPRNSDVSSTHATRRRSVEIHTGPSTSIFPSDVSPIRSCPQDPPQIQRTHADRAMVNARTRAADGQRKIFRCDRPGTGLQSAICVWNASGVPRNVIASCAGRSNGDRADRRKASTPGVSRSITLSRMRSIQCRGLRVVQIVYHAPSRYILL